MPGTDFDIIIGGYKAKIAHGEGFQGYRRRTGRKEIMQNLVTQAQDSVVLKSRQDGIGLYQTSWAGGAQWWKPLLTPGNLSSYFRSNHMDVWSEPGKVVPTNRHHDASQTSLHDNCIMATDGVDIYAIGDTNTTAASARDVYKWNSATPAWERETGYSSGIQDDATPLSMVYDSTDGYFYVLAKTAAGAWEIGRFKPSTSASNLSWVTGSDAPTHGSTLAISRYGLFFTVGKSVYEVVKATPTTTEQFDPGQDEILSLSGGSDRVDNAPLLINTPAGMYLVRNEVQQGQPMAQVYRIDRDTSGQFIGNPIAPLPVGSIALSVIFHMGQLLVATTPPRS